MTDLHHATSAPALALEGLTVRYPRPGRNAGGLLAVDDLSLTVEPGRTLAVVGESGSGKSTTLHALLGLTPRTAHVAFRRLAVRDGDGEAPREIADPRALRGRSVGLIPQDPVRALDPLVRIERHFAELHRHFLGLTDRADSRARAVAALADVGVDRPEARLRQYPHQLSGGQRQRVLIALALVGEPRLLLADEPTSNLDTTVQRRVLDLVDRVRAERGLAVLLVTHDIAVAAERAERLLVMRHGHAVETGPTREVLTRPRHPYTRELLAALPSRLPPRRPRPRAADEPPVLAATGLAKSFGGGRGAPRVPAVRDVDIALHRGRTVAVVGESGAGKSTLLRLLTGLDRPDAGTVTPPPGRGAGRAATRRVQLVYQNPARSLNPALTVGQIVAEPLHAHRVGTPASRAARVRELLAQVELPAETAASRPPRLSGGQLQRIAIARALALQPDVLVLDEPVSALDQAVRFALLRLLTELQERLDVAYLLVSHDLGVVRAVADEVLVIHRGRIVERGPTEDVFTAPTSPHTRALLDAVPTLPEPGPPPTRPLRKTTPNPTTNPTEQQNRTTTP
ncbi:dipeptide ABC transporter ATP-binding protein [Streptomyces triticirhizae]|uniref:ABC transporter ATP-binding protein n=1 Tax=Streptomyces triticirhizae TaxID=2483353 RepID=A0A3M2L1M9_9ACTN|nr:ABC transporter ATP-binding protein [Streptomyces triticirhizae]RMI31602.1 ABC transporter ATP-binding protein [Streptomyces triticirhizae]